MTAIPVRPELAPLTAPATRPAFETTLTAGPRLITVPWPGSQVSEVRLLMPMTPPATTPPATVLARLLPQLPAQAAPSLSDAAAGLGGSVEATVSAGWLTITAYTLTEHLPDLLDLLGRLRAAPMPDDLITTVIASAAQAAAADADRADAQARRILLGARYGPDWLAGESPTAAQLSALRPEDVRAAWRAIGETAATLLCVGPAHDQAVAAAETAFGTSSPGMNGPATSGTTTNGAATSGPATSSPATSGPAGKRLLTARQGAAQATIGLAGLAPALDDPGWPGFAVAHTAFGAMPTSRIMRSLREKHGYTYSPYSFVEHHRGAGHHIATIAVSAEVLEQALRVLLDDLAGMSTSPPAGAELDTARRSTVGRLMRTMHTPQGLASHVARLLTCGVPVPALDGLIGDLIAVDEQQAAEGARLLRPDISDLVIVGDVAPAGSWQTMTTEGRD